MATPRRAATAPASQERARGSSLAGGLRDLLLAVVAVLIVIGLVFAYSGVWPPMVVVESGSMMHTRDRSFLGVIDTGDLTLVKKVEREEDVITYMQGARMGYKTYGNYGDVLVYSKNGDRGQTPIIHRVVIRILVNESSPPGARTFDFPEADPPLYNVPDNPTNGNVTIGKVRTWDDNHPNGADANLSIDLFRIRNNMLANETHGGFITKGDHNPAVDQVALTARLPHPGALVQPVKLEWIIGRAQGELPWFGIIKLWAGGGSDLGPENSRVNLVVALLVIGIGPFAMEMAWNRYGDWLKARVPETWKKKWAGATVRIPGTRAWSQRRARLHAQEEEAQLRERKRRPRSRGP